MSPDKVDKIFKFLSQKEIEEFKININKLHNSPDYKKVFQLYQSTLVDAEELGYLYKQYRIASNILSNDFGCILCGDADTIKLAHLQSLLKISKASQVNKTRIPDIKLLFSETPELYNQIKIIKWDPLARKTLEKLSDHILWDYAYKFFRESYNINNFMNDELNTLIFLSATNAFLDNKKIIELQHVSTALNIYTNKLIIS